MNRKWWYLGGGMLIVGIALGGVLVRRQAVYERTYRIGFESDPPFHFPDAGGRPAGLVVDVLNEAARRTGIRLEWVFGPRSSEAELRSGNVDLWPIVTIRPERKAYIHFTEPYRESEACLVVRAEQPYRKLTDLDGRAVWHNGLPLTVRILESALPGAALHSMENPQGLLEKVCRGEADAAYMDEFTVISALMNGADCGGTPLRALAVPESRGQLGIGATFASAAAADILRDAISDMSSEGRLGEVVARWSYFSGRSMEQSSALVQARRRERIMIGATAAAVAMVLLTAWLALRIRQQSQRARRAEEDRTRLADQLQQAQRMESIGRLAGGVAHDFNNLLTVINGYAELLQDDEQLSDDHRTQVRQVSEAGRQAANLTQQLLAFSRKQLIEPRTLDLNAVVRSMTTMLGRLVGEDIELTTALEPDLAPVMADQGQLHQILMNLAVNARDAMPTGGALRIETAPVVVGASGVAGHPDAVPGAYVSLSISDTGVGMDADTLKHIFEPFFTTKGRGEGTGLGLSMVYGIVKQSKGWIATASEPGKGTTFTVFLPQAVQRASLGPAPEVSPQRVSGHETILLVEDQPGVRHLAASALRARGYKLIEAESGEDALRAAAAYASTIHLLLTDVVLPGMTGKELAERLTRVRLDMTVLFTSGYAESVIVHRGVLEPGIRYLPKPYAPHVLAMKVREVLDQRGAGRRAPPSPSNPSVAKG